MKKQLLFLTVFFSLLLSNGISQSVYVTKTGKKYHKETCRYLNNSSIELSLADAIEKGYTACSVCKPSSKPSQAPNSNNLVPKGTIKPDAGSVSVQCSAITKAGNRCKRMTKSPNGKCWQHGGN